MNYQSVYDCDLDADQKAENLKVLEKEIASLIMERQKLQIETTRS